DVDVFINSLGGSVYEALAIYSLLKRYDKGTVTIYIDGMAVSAAAVIALAGKKVVVYPHSVLMLHAPWMISDGNSKELQKDIGVLQKLEKSLSTILSTRLDNPAQYMDGEDYWFVGQEIVDIGAADFLSSDESISDKLNLESIKNKYYGDTNSMTKELKINNTIETSTSSAEDKLETARNENERVKGILNIFSTFEGHEELLEDCITDIYCSVEAASKKLINELKAEAKPVQKVEPVADEQDKKREGMTSALLARAGLAKVDKQNEYNSLSLLEMARSSVKEKAYNRLQTVANAFTHSTSDFPLILENIANKSLLRGYEEAP